MNVPNDTDLLFTYGTLKKGFQNQTARYLHQHHTFLGEGYFYGKLFRVDFYPGAVYIPDTDSKVFGHLFRINNNKASLFEKLDYYEGIGPKFPEPQQFIKSVIPIQFNGNIVEAQVYLLHAYEDQYPLISSGQFSPPSQSTP